MQNLLSEMLIYRKLMLSGSRLITKGVVHMPVSDDAIVGITAARCFALGGGEMIYRLSHPA